MGNPPLSAPGLLPRIQDPSHRMVFVKPRLDLRTSWQELDGKEETSLSANYPLLKVVDFVHAFPTIKDRRN
jgi:hypothetical protein